MQPSSSLDRAKRAEGFERVRCEGACRLVFDLLFHFCLKLTDGV